MANHGDRWAGRPVSGAIVSASVFLIPMGAAVAGGWLSHRVVAAPGTLGLRAIWWLGQIAFSAVVFATVNRVTRRMLPLAALLKMTMVFPDRAPSRLAVARRAGRTKDLHLRVDEAPTGSIGEAATRILSLATALSNHDRRTRGHSERVRVLTDMIADELQLPDDARDQLRWSSLLHDIGKLTVHPDILNNPGKPTAEEWISLQRHPLEGAKLTAPLSPWLGEWALAVEQHHEKYDGSGYPYGLAADQISYGARIVAVADVFETMTAKRSYKDAISPAAARVELTRCAGSQFDADVVRAFLNISLGRLWWTVGPASLIAQVPFLGQIPLVGGQATGALAGLTSATALGVAALSMGSVVMPHMVASATAGRTPAAMIAAKPAEVQLAMVTGTTSVPPPPPDVGRGRATAAVATEVVPGATASPPAGSNPVAGTSVPATPGQRVRPISVTTAVPTTVKSQPVASPAPTMVPSLKLPLVTLPPVTVPLAPLPAITVPPVTVPRVTVPPVTVPPVTLPPVTLPPAKKAPGGLLSPVAGLLKGLLGSLGLKG